MLKNLLILIFISLFSNACLAAEVGSWSITQLRLHVVDGKLICEIPLDAFLAQSEEEDREQAATNYVAEQMDMLKRNTDFFQQISMIVITTPKTYAFSSQFLRTLHFHRKLDEDGHHRWIIQPTQTLRPSQLILLTPIILICGLGFRCFYPHMKLTLVKF